MKNLLTAIICSTLLVPALARAADKPEKPDCTEKQKAADDANAAVKAAIKPDLSSCSDKKGREKLDCEKPLKEKAKADTQAAKEKAKQARMALACCKTPKKAGCTP